MFKNMKLSIARAWVKRFKQHTVLRTRALYRIGTELKNNNPMFYWDYRDNWSESQLKKIEEDGQEGYYQLVDKLIENNHDYAYDLEKNQRVELFNGVTIEDFEPAWLQEQKKHYIGVGMLDEDCEMEEVFAYSRDELSEHNELNDMLRELQEVDYCIDDIGMPNYNKTLWFEFEVDEFMDFILEGLYGAFWLLVNMDAETISAIDVTLRTSTISIIFSIIIGFPLGFVLGFFNFPGRRTLRLISDTLLATPTVVIGLLVYAFISYRGPLGEYELLFTMKGIIIGQTLLALPIVVSLSAAAIEGMDRKLFYTLSSFGLTTSQMIINVVWELRHALMAAAVTAYGRVIAEVGVAMMIGGNIKYHTRTITTAISLETSKGMFSMGIALGIVLILIAFLVNLTLYRLRRNAKQF